MIALNPGDISIQLLSNRGCSIRQVWGIVHHFLDGCMLLSLFDGLNAHTNSVVCHNSLSNTTYTFVKQNYPKF